MHLREHIDNNMLRAINNVRDIAQEIWKTPKHKYYTDHSVDHSNRIISILDGLTSGIMNSEAPLSKNEIYILLAATYLHDIGMQNERYAGGVSSTHFSRRVEVENQALFEAY
ncbi:MAG: hypothetical protein OEZ02_15325 [Anaerolineae bacterium]|nr:hypothetical protein [Anaerolineae bacterium]